MISQVIINGSTHEVPHSTDTLFYEAIQYVEQNLLGTQNVISAIRIDGIELTEEERNNIAEIPVKDLGGLEILTASPREIADDTIQSLIPYVETLAALAPSTIENGEYNEELFGKLLDGLELLADAVQTVKRALNVDSVTELNSAEEDLTIQLSLVLQARKSENFSMSKEILTVSLPAVLDNWVKNALPALASSRDS